MQVFIASDHGGVQQKDMLVGKLSEAGYSVTDCGSYNSQAADDYPDFGLAVGRAIMQDPNARGVLLCRSGEGMEMVANKLPKVRAALVWRPDVAAETRRDNDANIVVLPSDFISDKDAFDIVTTFLETPFSGEERHVRRLEKISNIERASYE